MGLWQVMPFHFKPGEDPFDPLTNTRVALRYYKQQRDKFGPGLAAAAYQGGDGAIVNGRARTDVSDGNMTPAEYAAAWKANYDRIKATAPPQATGAGYAGSAQGVASLYGGTIPPITQEFGRTDFSTGSGSDIYDFGSEMGLDGDSHTGWDVGSAVGTNFYMPAGLGGTVEIAGGSGFYTDETKGNAPGTGELRINLDNGMQLILGHNAAINVKQGQRVTAGMLLGQTGYANGAHQHVEVRVRDNSTRSGWRIVDPSTLFGNAR
jgi:murein DD-endopeptidase MepM/ murein hydrolase activator NlpD